jgi:hypothetical protein
MSAFALEDDVVCRTYSAYARAMDGLWGMLQWLDRAPQDATKRAAGIGSRTSTTPRHLTPRATRTPCARVDG